MANLISKIPYLMSNDDINTSELSTIKKWSNGHYIEHDYVNNVDLTPVVCSLEDYLNIVQGDKFCIIAKYDDGYEYCVVVVGNPFTWDGSFTTLIGHYDRRNDTKKWNSVDPTAINAEVFPSLTKTSIDSRLWLNFTNGQVFDESLTPELVYDNGDEIFKVERQEREDLELFPLGYEDVLISNEPKHYEKILKPNLVSYYKYLRHIALGKSMETTIIQDLIKRDLQ